jgi:hypothetical protein
MRISQEINGSTKSIAMILWVKYDLNIFPWHTEARVSAAACIV